MSNLTKTKCILWTGYTNANGYGHRRLGKKMVYVHRLAYCEANGLKLDDIKGRVIRHSCDTPSCYNPDHLREGTQQDNMDDRSARGRHVASPGEKNGMAKLTSDQIVEIRRIYATGAYTQKTIGKVFDVSQTLVSAIVNNKIWRTT